NNFHRRGGSGLADPRQSLFPIAEVEQNETVRDRRVLDDGSNTIDDAAEAVARHNHHGNLLIHDRYSDRIRSTTDGIAANAVRRNRRASSFAGRLARLASQASRVIADRRSSGAANPRVDSCLAAGPATRSYRAR